MKNRWDQYFYGVCEAVSKNSSCLSRRIGAILVRDRGVVATAYNGPPIGIPHCNSYSRRKHLHENFSFFPKDSVKSDLDVCPRKLMGFKSGQGVEYCIASHAERNLLIQCARLGIAVKGTTLYMNAPVLPCKECFLELIQAQIREIVCLNANPYNDIDWLLKHSNVQIREFYL